MTDPVRFARQGLTNGAQLYAAVLARSGELGVPLKDYVYPLNSNTAEFLKGLLRSVTPTNLTIDRVEALLNDQPMPARQKRERRSFLQDTDRRPFGPIPEPVERTPCQYCGTRADIGCKHQRRLADQQANNWGNQS